MAMFDDDFAPVPELTAADEMISDDQEMAVERPLIPDMALSLDAQIEAIVFASSKPVKAAEIVDIVQGGRTLREIEVILDDLVRFYHERRGGFRLEYLPGMGYQFRTDIAAAPVMERMFASRPRPLSRAAQETLSVIAYRQPITRAEVEFVRGVDAGSIFKTLLDKNLIECVGRKNETGRPMLFGTTEEFLRVYGLASLKDLPTLMSVQPSMEMVNSAEQRIQGASAVDPGDFGPDDDDAIEQMDYTARLGLEPTGGDLDQGGADQG